jgi:hypothetical protein
MRQQLLTLVDEELECSQPWRRHVEGILWLVRNVAPQRA